jgi:hypothetical protein
LRSFWFPHAGCSPNLNLVTFFAPKRTVPIPPCGATRGRSAIYATPICHMYASMKLIPPLLLGLEIRLDWLRVACYFIRIRTSPDR